MHGSDTGLARRIKGLARYLPWSAALLCGCHWPATTILVRVCTDLPHGAADPLATVQLRVWSGGFAATTPPDETVRLTRTVQPSPSQALAAAGSVPSCTTEQLLGTATIIPRSDNSTGAVTVSAQALAGDSRVLAETRAVGSYVRERTVVMELFLAANCDNTQCQAGYICGHGGCEPIQRGALPALGSYLDGGLSFDARTAPDAAPEAGLDAFDASMDSAMDAPLTCEAGTSNCSGLCVSLGTDNNNCGACGRVCGAQDGGPTACANGVCVLVCPSGSHPCGGLCRSDTDINACGPTCMTCTGAVAPATNACINNACGRACPTNLALVGGRCVTLGAARPVWPLSGGVVNTRVPSLRARRAATDTTTPAAHFDVCADRACTTRIATGDAAYDASGLATLPVTTLPTSGRVFFWRVQGTSLEDHHLSAVVSAAWEFFPLNAGASAPLSWSPRTDFDGDGLAEVAVGHALSDRILAWGFSPTWPPSSGPTVLSPPDTNSNYGASVAATDFNGDGFVDLVLGAPNFGSPTNDGQVTVLSGASRNALATVQTTFQNPDGTQFGSQVQSAGDVDGDGYGDVVSAANPTCRNQGCVYVYFGRPTPGVLRRSNLYGLTTGDHFGEGFLGGYDLDGDLRSDLVVGAPSADSAGLVYFFTSANLTSRAGSPPTSSVPFSLMLSGDEPSHTFGTAMAAFDYDRDGDLDLVVGAPGAVVASGPNTGKIYFFSNSGSGPTISTRLSLPPPIAPQAGERFGSAFATGDFNGDGFAELAVASPQWGTTASPGAASVGRVFVFSSSLSPSATTLTASAVALPMIRLTAQLQTGSGMSCPGDLNGDGFDDLLVGVRDDPDGSGQNGAVVVFLGGPSGLSRSVVLRDFAGNPNFGTYLARLLAQPPRLGPRSS